MKATVLIPIYEHKDAIGGVVDDLLPYGLPILIVDDGSGPETRRVLDALEARHGAVTVHHRARNGGRGAALKTGYRLACERGFSHALQLDADGQHRASDVPAFLAAMERDPEALVLGAPIFDETAPRSRLYGRQLSRVMVWLTTLSLDVNDPLCGFRGIPLAPTLARLDRVATGDHMEFDPELVIRLHWAGVPVRNVATRVVYRNGGLSHFDMLRDNARMTGLYTRAVGGMLLRLPGRALGRAGVKGASAP
ncbi:MAG: glycosyltransferase family 2 protein [Myxococcales bacterium]|nr:glycosyltransferase family 2 protein [Myxococcales bacterium]